MRVLTIFLSTGLVALALASCGDSGSSGSGKPVVVGTTTQVGDFL